MNEQQMLTEVGKRLKYWRNQRGITQAEVVRRMSISRIQISNVKRGQGGGRLWTLARLCFVYGISLSTLFEEEN